MVLTALAAAGQPTKPADLQESADDSQAVLQVVRSLWSRALLWGREPTALDVPTYVATAVHELVSKAPDRPIDLSVRPTKVQGTVAADKIDQAGGQSAVAAVAVASALCESWATRPPAALKSGGLGVRELSATASALHLDEPTGAFWVELVAAAGLVALEDPAKAFAPTIGFDAWSVADLPDQWTRLASAWIRMDRDTDRVGDTGADGQRLLALGPGLVTPDLAKQRRSVLSVLGQVPAGSILAVEEIEAVLADQLPRLRPTTRERAVRTVLAQADLLGVTARGCLTALGRALCAPGATLETMVTVAHSLLPNATEEFLAQADLTLVVPGPPSPSLKSLLNLVADVESTGGAVVYRVTPTSVARILETGRSPQEVLGELASRSVTPLPQPLEYLVNDVARRHGMVRVGVINSYLRSDDEAFVTEVMNHPQSALLGLVRLAPTVAVSAGPTQALIELARDLGHEPLAEGGDGSVVPIPRVIHRAPDLPVAVDRGGGFDTVFVDALVRALRRVEAQSAADSKAIAGGASDSVGAVAMPRMAVAQSVAALRAALTHGFPVWVGYADNAGSMTLRLVDVVAFDAGAISAYDHNACVIRTLALSRITGVERAVVDGEDGSVTPRTDDLIGGTHG